MTGHRLSVEVMAAYDCRLDGRHGLQHVVCVAVFPRVIVHVRVDPVMVGVRQRIDVVVETPPRQPPAHDLRLRRQTAHARRKALAGNDVTLARVERRQEEDGWQDGNSCLGGGRRSPGQVAAQRRVEEPRPRGVQIVAEVLAGGIVEGRDHGAEQRVRRGRGDEPVHYVGSRLLANDKHVLVVLLADETRRVPRPGVHRADRVHVQVDVDAAVAVQDEVAAGVGPEHRRLVAVVEREIVGVVADDELTDVV